MQIKLSPPVLITAVFGMATLTGCMKIGPSVPGWYVGASLIAGILLGGAVVWVRSLLNKSSDD